MKKSIIILFMTLFFTTIAFGQNSKVDSHKEGIINKNDLPEIYKSYNFWQLECKSVETSLLTNTAKYDSAIQLNYTVEPIRKTPRNTYLHGLEYNVTTGKFVFEAFN